jgi:hypothetical protein
MDICLYSLTDSCQTGGLERRSEAELSEYKAGGLSMATVLFL